MGLKTYPSYVDPATYDATPKSVWADIAYSLALRLTGEESHDGARTLAAGTIIAEEWVAHQAGIVKQKPREMEEWGMAEQTEQIEWTMNAVRFEMMPEQLQCPDCGGVLELEKGSVAHECQGCGHKWYVSSLTLDRAGEVD